MEKRSIVLGLLIASISSSVFAIGRIGPPTAEHRKGQFGVDLGYTYSSEDLKKQRPKISSTESGSWVSEEFMELPVGEGEPSESGWIVIDSGIYFENNHTGEGFERGMSFTGFDEDGNPEYEDFDYSWDADATVSFAKFKFDKLKTSRYFSTLSYGIADDWEISATLGFAQQVETGLSGRGARWELDEETGEPIEDPYGSVFGWAFDENSPFFGIGTKYTFLQQDKIKWGAALQANWLKAKGDVTSHQTYDGDDEWGVHRIRDAYEAEYWELTLAVGPTIDMGGWKLYGGPFFYWLSGEMKGRRADRETETEEVDFGEGDRYRWHDDETTTTKFSADLKAKSNFGGFVGAQVDLGNNARLGAEFAHNGSGYAFSASIGMSF